MTNNTLVTEQNSSSPSAMPDHHIICGDSRNILSGFVPGSVDLVVTDPPYLCRYRDRNGRTLRNDNNPEAVLSVFDEVYRILKPNSYCISFYGWNAVADFTGAWVRAGFKIIGHIVWIKNYASSQGHTSYRHESAFVLVKGFPPKPAHPISDVQPWTYTGNRLHPTEKSPCVTRPLIEAFSRPGELVVDPFAGSGSTVLAAAQRGRRAIGIELDENYCALAQQRLVKSLTSKAA